MATRQLTLRGCMRFFTIIILTILFLAESGPVMALSYDEQPVDPLDPDKSYSAVLYNNTNGLPTSEANDIAETQDGFIWIGSYSGLIRYDGNTFERIDSTGGITSVVSLMVDSLERLWIGTNDNGLFMMEKGSFSYWGIEDGLRAEKICDIAEDDDGLIYIGTTNGVMTIGADGRMRHIRDRQIEDAYVETLKTGADGLIYGVTNKDDLFTLKDGRIYNYISHLDSKIGGVLYLSPDENSPGYIYIGTDTSSLFYAHISDNFNITSEWDISPLSNIADIQQIGRQIWICARNGIGIMTSEGFTMLGNLPMNNSVGHMMRDYEGNFWFTSSRQGVMKLVANRFVDIFEKYHLEDTVINSTCLLDGKLFMATDTGPIVIDENGPVDSIPLKSAKTAGGQDLQRDDLLDLLLNCRIRSIIRDRQDRLWISTWRSRGLVCYDHGQVTCYTEEDGMISDHIRAICQRDDGAILVALSGGVNVIENGEVTRAYRKNYGIQNEEILTVSYNPNGDILLGSNGDGIYVINDSGIRRLYRQEGLTSGIIMRIKYDPARQLYWIVSGNALAYMTMDYRITTINNFPYSNNFDLYEDQGGNMWVLSSNGIYVVSVDQLLANSTDMDTIHYSLANGMPCISVSNSYSELTDDGILYLAGSTGVARVNINEAMMDGANIKVAIPYVEADGIRLYPDKTGTVTVGSHVQKLTVYGYVFNYLLNDPQVSYQLVGFDQQPIILNRSELQPVSYTNLSGGSYRFELKLAKGVGLSERLVTVNIVKQKKLTEQPLFYVIATALFLLAVGLYVRRYIDRQRRIMETRQRQQVEKERLETELQTASRIQFSMLPHNFPPFPQRHEFDIFASMDPAREVGGDFYDFFLLDDDHLCLIIADVSGKGIPASLFMMASMIVLKNWAATNASPAEIMAKTNEALCSNNQEEMFVTVWLGILEISSGRITAANAGHEYPAIAHGDRYEMLRDRHSLVLGGLAGVKYSEYEIQLQPGDRLFVYTDGLPEATDADNVIFGEERLLEVLNANAQDSPEELLTHVTEAVDDFVRDAEQFDDLTMMCFRYNGKK